MTEDNMETPTAIAVFFSWGDSFFSKAISKVTGGPSHTGVVFSFADRQAILYEALVGKGVRCKPFSKLADWANKNDKRRFIAVQLKDIPSKVLLNKWYRAEDFRGMSTYSEWQLLRMFLFKKYGRRVKETKRGVVCSEFVVRIMQPEYDFKDFRPDEISPAMLYEYLIDLEAKRAAASND